MEDFDFEETESVLESFLKQYRSLKETGQSCKVVEARKWYTNIANEAQANLNKALGYYFINLQQKLPHSKLETEELDLVMDDGNYIKGCIEIWNTALTIVHELYKNPKKYDYWKGEIEINIEPGENETKAKKVKDMAYYFEPKVEKKESTEMLYL